ncbi:MAG: helix-turn-helix transcriptional regulator [Planctomycetaceae bacterium]
MTLDGKSYVLVDPQEYARLLEDAGKMPSLPDSDERGNYPAVEYARASLARKIILRRQRTGLSQAELARRAGIRPETLIRLERGITTPGVATVDKIDRALARAEERRRIDGE